MNKPEFRKQTATALEEAAAKAGPLTAFVGFDGFVDEIIHIVAKRHNVSEFDRVPKIEAFGKLISDAAGKSTNFELVNVLSKIGGNGPIMANALATFGVGVTYIGALGYPNLHPVFEEFSRRAKVHSIADPGHTDAFEFSDGKLLMGKLTSLTEINWQNIQQRFGREAFDAQFGSADLVGMVNWTMLPFMSDIWDSVLAEVCPSLTGPRRKMFFDLCDPQKRPHDDITRALDLINNFNRHFDVILGLNEKEAVEIAGVLGVAGDSFTPESLAKMSEGIFNKLSIDTLVVHPVRYALSVRKGETQVVQGPVVNHPKITTGAGDHFNSGFCLGRLLGLTLAQSVLAGVSTSGFYVRTAKSPTIADLAGMMRDWPTEGAA